MKEIPLTQGYVALVDDADYERVMAFKWHAKVDDNTVYAAHTVHYRKVMLHNFILNPAPGFRADHKDGNGLNCQRTNLRICTIQQNGCNCRPKANGNSGYKGVSYNRSTNGKYMARIHVGRKFVTLGLFSDPVEAARVYDQAALQHFGEFAWLNFPGRAPTEDPDAPAVPAPVAPGQGGRNGGQ
jgi:hypothetical protein